MKVSLSDGTLYQKMYTPDYARKQPSNPGNDNEDHSGLKSYCASRAVMVFSHNHNVADVVSEFR